MSRGSLKKYFPKELFEINMETGSFFGFLAILKEDVKVLCNCLFPSGDQKIWEIATQRLDKSPKPLNS
ncbi:MAG: hypothetical protein A3F67_06515 [Verrucomicrobia bacterium RIFCSPHIGHO2_12_FULL_41_10]|nr:MAG: hypothetical protein A3F67_06515 [Verrucomicrobia bacterium RIFCSPHIGHO2_12_FULL_41_10]